MSRKQDLPQYKFAQKYDVTHAKTYFEKHQEGALRRLSNWREHAMARKALEMAGRPRAVLDLPCGTGRFWGLLAEEKGRVIHVADNSQNMIDVGMTHRPPEITRRSGSATGCSAFATGFPDGFVDCVFCFRLLHHIGKSEDRVRMLKEFARVSSGTVIVSLWVDGNYRGWREQRRLRRKELESGVLEHNRYVIRRQDIEAEFAEAGLRRVGHIDFVPGWDKWRVYVLAVNKGGLANASS